MEFGDLSKYRGHAVCVQTPGFIAEYTYYVEVQLIKTIGTASPGLLSLQICDTQDACDP